MWSLGDDKRRCRCEELRGRRKGAISGSRCVNTTDGEHEEVMGGGEEAEEGEYNSCVRRCLVLVQSEESHVCIWYLIQYFPACLQQSWSQITEELLWNNNSDIKKKVSC